MPPRTLVLVRAGGSFIPGASLCLWARSDAVKKCCGAPGGNRTPDLDVRTVLLYPLSYEGVNPEFTVRRLRDQDPPERSDLAAAAALSAIGRGGVLVSLGGDISVAGEPPTEGWLIPAGEDSAAPIRRGEETISIRSGGVATSSTTVRRWTRGGVALHHIIDPATGLPSDGPWRTATVIAGTCVDANIASTAAIVMGEAANRWLEKTRLPARLVDRTGSVYRLAGWPKPSESTLISQQTHRQSRQH